MIRLATRSAPGHGRDLSEVAEAHGFKLKTWGQRRNAERFLVRSRLIAIIDHLVEASDDDGT